MTYQRKSYAFELGETGAAQRVTLAISIDGKPFGELLLPSVGMIALVSRAGEKRIAVEVVRKDEAAFDVVGEALPVAAWQLVAMEQGG